MKETIFRQSSYNILIPVSAIMNSDEKQYIVANPLYGNVSLINAHECEVLQEFPNVCEDTLLSQFKDEGYLTSLTEEEEREFMKKRYEAQKEPTNPRTAIIVTYQCNLRCTYCWGDFLFTDTALASTIIDEKTVDAVFETIPEIPALESVEEMSFYGGEPFLPSTLPAVTYILEKGSEKGFTFHANTNGYYLKRFVPLLAQYSVEGLGVTLDGCQPVHDARRTKSDSTGTFHQIVEGIDAALDAGIPIGVRINVDSENIPHLRAFGDWIKEKGWVTRRNISFAITPVLPGKENSPPGALSYSEMAQKMLVLAMESPSLYRMMNYMWEYENEGYLTCTILQGTELRPRPFYCSAHNQVFSFDPFGDIYPCPRAVGDKSFSIGRFIPDLQFNEHFTQWSNRDVLSIPQCKDCDIALLCGGGCAYEASLQFDTLYRGCCERYRTFLEYGLPLFLRLRLRRERGV
jgi:uncharacterized protein